MGRYNIEYWIPYDTDKINLQDLRWRPLNIDTIYFRERKEIIDEKIPEVHEILKEILLSDVNTGTEKNPVIERPAFVYISKNETKSVKEAANHLGFPKSRNSKTIIVEDAIKKIYVLTVLNDGNIPIDAGITINETKEKLTNLKLIDSASISDHTGMESGWCSPFLAKEDYLNNVQYLLFGKGYFRVDKLVDIGLGPKESILMRPKDVYSILKSRYSGKVFTF